jgi:hypothetical protein
VLIGETAVTLAGFSWVEGRLFEIVGGWVATTAEPEVVALFAVQSRHHGWRAELWEGQQPLLHDIEVPRVPPEQELVAVFGEVAAAAATADRLVGLYRVLLPWVAAGYRTLVATASEVADGPVARVARIVLGDLEVDCRAGERVIESTITDADVAQATARQSHLEVALRAGPR